MHTECLTDKNLLHRIYTLYIYMYVYVLYIHIYSIIYDYIHIHTSVCTFTKRLSTYDTVSGKLGARSLKIGHSIVILPKGFGFTLRSYSIFTIITNILFRTSRLPFALRFVSCTDFVVSPAARRIALWELGRKQKSKKLSL